MSTETGTGDAYLLYHSIGQYPGKHADMLAGLTDFTDAWAAPNGDQWADVLPKRQQFIDLWAELIGAPKGTVTTTESVTTGLMAVIGALPEGTLRGKKVLVAEDGFPSLHFLLTGLSKRFGFTLNTVPIRQGGIGSRPKTSSPIGMRRWRWPCSLGSARRPRTGWTSRNWWRMAARWGRSSGWI